MMLRRFVFLALLVAPALHAEEGRRRLSLSQAVELAVTDSPEVLLADEGVGAAASRLDGARALRLPSLNLEGNVFLWNEKLVFDLNGGAMLPEGTEAPVIRDQVTSSATVTVAQPLSGLAVISNLVGVHEHGLAAARADRDMARLDAAYRAAEGYLRLLQAAALRDVTAAAVASIEAQEQRAQVLASAGVLGKVDLLRLEAARLDAQQRLMRADAAVTTAERGLVLAIGLPEATRVEVFDDLPTPPPALPWTEEQAVEAALAARPELRAASRRVDQAARGQDVARAELFPNVMAIGTYQHNEGQGTFAQKDSLFVGLTLSWNVWDWGHDRAAVREAGHDVNRAEIARDATRDQVVFEVRRRWLDAATAYRTLAVADSGHLAAQEAWRLQSIRFEGGDATTTDVLEAEAELARARGQQVLARYEYYLSLVALARAVGELPTAVR